MQSLKAKHKQILTIATPVIVTSMVTQIQILTDSIFVGHLDSSLFAAIGNVMFPLFLAMSFLWATPTGTTVLIAQKIGAKKPDEGAAVAESSFKFNTLIALGLAVVWFFACRPIFVLMGVTEPVLTQSVAYARILSAFLLMLGIHSTIAAIFQGIGITVPVMVVGFFGSVMNIFLDWVMIFGKFGFPAMGLAGAAWATVISSVLGFPIIFIWLLALKRKPFHMHAGRMLKRPLKDYLPVLKIGLPAGLEDVLWNGGNLVLVRFLNALAPLGPGIYAVGVYTLITRIASTPVLVYLGFSKAAQTLVGNRTGEKDSRGAIRDGLHCMIWTAAVTVVFVVIFTFWPGQTLGIFTKDTELIRISIPYLFLFTAALIPQAFNITIGHSIRGFGDTRWMLLTQIGGTIFMIVGAWIFMFPLKFAFVGLFIIMIADEIIRAAINFFRYMKGPFWPANKEAHVPEPVTMEGAV
jgi:putative MATE family efflux protein